MAITGSCLCGAVTYVCEGEPRFSGLCHCRNCQKFSGSAFGVVSVYPSSQVKISGKMTTYRDTGNSGKAFFRNFCPVCGSGISATGDAIPGVTVILAGTLDDTATFNPSMELFCDSAQPWTQSGGERVKHAGMPG